jgi:hypothetical protein
MFSGSCTPGSTTAPLSGKMGSSLRQIREGLQEWLVSSHG